MNAWEVPRRTGLSIYANDKYRLSVYHDGTQQRLTDVYDNVLKPLLA
jgi:hypothetical protein